MLRVDSLDGTGIKTNMCGSARMNYRRSLGTRSVMARTILKLTIQSWMLGNIGHRTILSAVLLKSHSGLPILSISLFGGRQSEVSIQGSIWFHDFWLAPPEQGYWQNRETANVGLDGSVGRAPARQSGGRRFKSSSSKIFPCLSKFI